MVHWFTGPALWPSPGPGPPMLWEWSPVSGLNVLPVINMINTTVPMSRIRSARLAVPWVNAVFRVPDDGVEDLPRTACAVGRSPRFRAVAGSGVQPCNTPSRTSTRCRVGREPVTRGQCGSSINDRPGGKTGARIVPVTPTHLAPPPPLADQRTGVPMRQTMRQTRPERCLWLVCAGRTETVRRFAVGRRSAPKTRISLSWFRSLQW